MEQKLNLQRFWLLNKLINISNFQNCRIKADVSNIVAGSFQRLVFLISSFCSMSRQATNLMNLNTPLTFLETHYGRLLT